MPLNIITGDICKQNTDIIVNAANSHLQAGGGVCGAIFKRAGYNQLQKECDEIGYCKTGEACYTSGYNLCKYIIHAVGPIYSDGKHNEKHLLKSAYRNSMKIAKELKVDSISFPLISAGIYGYPKADALSIAIQTLGQETSDNDICVNLVIFDKPDNYLDNSRKRFLSQFEIQNYNRLPDVFMGASESSPMLEVSEVETESVPTCGVPFDFEDLDENFRDKLFKLIDAKGLSDVEVYKRANFDRKQFSKLRSIENYNPSKNTALAYAIAVRATLDETKDLLLAAGYGLSNSNVTDRVVRFYIESGIYNIFVINETLYRLNQKCLGGSSQ